MGHIDRYGSHSPYPAIRYILAPPLIMTRIAMWRVVRLAWDISIPSTNCEYQPYHSLL